MTVCHPFVFSEDFVPIALPDEATVQDEVVVELCGLARRCFHPNPGTFSVLTSEVRDGGQLG